MAAKQDVAPRAQRLAALGAVGLLSAATALAFGRVFVGHAPTEKLLIAAVASVALAAAFERRSLLLATVASAAALLVVIGVFVFPETTWLGLPTRETLHAAADALGRVGHEARVQVAPSEPLRPLILAALTAVWTASFSAHALAIRAGSPLLAVLPPVALVGFADTVLEDGARPMYALLLLVAALLVVFTDGLRRIRQWGPVWSSPGRRRLSSVAGRGARRVGLTTLVVALAFPGVLPGFRAEALVDFSTDGNGGARLDPFVSIQANLTRDTPIPLFRVTSRDGLGNPYPAYWRSFSLDQFDGKSWRSSDPNAERGQLTSSPATLEPQFTPPADAVTTVTQEFRVLAELDDTTLPMAYPPRMVDVSTGQIRYDAELGAVAVPGRLEADTAYRVSSAVVVPTAAELDDVVPSSANPTYTRLPDSLPPVVTQIAERWAASATAPDPYREILAIMDHFTQPGAFVYNANVDLRDDPDALVSFLTRTHTGFCQQFATAMAVLVRALGYPARVAVGYRTGDLNDGAFTVTTEDAHAWVEVRFPGYGWLPFEPTPRRPNPIGQHEGSYLNPATTIKGSDQQTEGAAGGKKTSSSNQTGFGCFLNGRRAPSQACDTRLGTQVGRFGGRGLSDVGTTFDPPADGYGVPLRLVASILLLLGLLLLVLVPAVKWLVRLRIAHRHGPPRQMVLAAYRLFDGEAADVGLGRRDGETLSEHRDRLSDRVRFSDGQLARLTATASRAAYSDTALGDDDARLALHDARVAIRDVRRDVGAARRLLGVYRPRI